MGRLPLSGVASQPAASGASPSGAAETRVSFAERRAHRGGRKTPSRLVEGNHLIQDIDRPPPGDVIHKGVDSTPSRSNLARKRSNLDFFENAFSVDQSSSSWARERIQGDAIVTAEVKTNVIIGDEYTFITELSYHLSTRYQRPVSSIVVTLQHGACMFFAGSFEAAYVMSVFALPSQLLPTTNKRNAALIQKHMQEATGVKPARGLLRFVPTKEEHLACNGRTMAGEIDELEKSFYREDASFTGGGEAGKADDGTAMMLRSMRSMKKPGVKVPGAGILMPELTRNGSADEGLPPVPGSPVLSPETATTSTQDEDVAESSPQRLTARRKKSFVANIFSRSGGKSLAYRSSLPAISDER
ncbi:hypothetical protein MFIFM68171_10676 [Madurella fahalii]|uniref:L-dopachrome isomerase n=1 Tax=Madurella fahalii TaxID=1157608 RepID=A0ABQ0GRV3_9PEZI